MITFSDARRHARRGLMGGTVAISAVLPALPHVALEPKDRPVWAVLPDQHQPHNHEERSGSRPIRTITVEVGSASSTDVFGTVNLPSLGFPIAIMMSA